MEISLAVMVELVKYAAADRNHEQGDSSLAGAGRWTAG